MYKFGKGVVKFRIPIVIIALMLLIPSVFGIIKTRINYDILSYLPSDIETMEGQDIMLKEFGKGGFAFVVVDDMKDKDVVALKEKIQGIDSVSDVLWYDTIADISLPKEVLPENIYDFFNGDNSTMMAVFFNKSTSADESLEAVEQIREYAGEQCFVSGMTAIVEDIKNLTMEETTIYVLIAVILSSIILAVTMDSFLLPILFLLSIGAAIIYNLGSNIIQGEISFITQALTAVLQLAVTMDYSIFLWHSYKEQKELNPNDKNEAMAVAIGNTISSVVSSSITTVAGFLALCFMSYTLGLDMGIVMAKGVIIGVICCVTLLPSMILIFDKAIEKTMHRDFIPKFDRASSFIVKHNAVFAVLFVALLIPASFPSRTSRVVTLYPCDSAQWLYILKSISVQSCASVPPAPAWKDKIAFCLSYSPVSRVESVTSSSSFTSSLMPSLASLAESSSSISSARSINASKSLY